MAKCPDVIIDELQAWSDLILSAEIGPESDAAKPVDRVDVKTLTDGLFDEMLNLAAAIVQYRGRIAKFHADALNAMRDVGALVEARPGELPYARMVRAKQERPEEALRIIHNAKIMADANPH